MTALHHLTIAEAGRRFRDGSLSPVALTEVFLERIAAVDGTLDSVITLVADAARAEAKTAARDLAEGRDKGPLHGIPIGLKDIYDTAGVATTCHSNLMVDNVPTADAESVMRLRTAGTIMLAKLATHEFAFGGPSFDLPFPPARNPWNPDHIPAGSSSGSGAAVAAGLVPAALGSDTGGSIRSPAGMCGIVGLKPTYGRVSRRGVFPLSFSQDTVGPMTWTVEDCAIVLQAIAGHDPDDPASVDTPVPDYRAGLTKDGATPLSGVRVGVARSWYDRPGLASDEVLEALDGVHATLSRLGADLVDVELPDAADFHACGRIVILSEAFQIHRRNLTERPEMFGQFSRDRLRLGAFIDSAHYLGAQRMRRVLAERVFAATADVDVVVTANQWGPAESFETATTPFPFFGKPYLTMPFNVTGQPALTMRCGMSSASLPIGFQIAGKPFDEATVLRVAHAYERARGELDLRPPV